MTIEHRTLNVALAPTAPRVDRPMLILAIVACLGGFGIGQLAHSTAALSAPSERVGSAHRARAKLTTEIQAPSGQASTQRGGSGPRAADRSGASEVARPTSGETARSFARGTR